MNLQKKAAVLSVAAAFAGVAGDAPAADTHTITVSATVNGTCRFQGAATSTIALTVDPSAATTVSNTGTVLYRCTKGQSPSFTMQSSSTLSPTGGNVSGPSPATTESFPYTYTSTNTGAGTGFGTGNDKTLSVTVSVVQSAAANVSAGVYTDTITVSLNP